MLEEQGRLRVHAQAVASAAATSIVIHLERTLQRGLTRSARTVSPHRIRPECTLSGRLTLFPPNTPPFVRTVLTLITAQEVEEVRVVARLQCHSTFHSELSVTISPVPSTKYTTLDTRHRTQKDRS